MWRISATLFLLVLLGAEKEERSCARHEFRELEMKTKWGFVLVLLSCVCLLGACQKEPAFDYPMETLYGTWNGTDVKTSSGWVNIESSYFSDLQFSITFFEDGSYRGRGYFGNGTGTYTASGKTIVTYVNDKEYYRYDVISLVGNIGHLRMYCQGETMAETSEIEIKVKKVQ